jgi:hypothetical protein
MTEATQTQPSRVVETVWPWRQAMDASSVLPVPSAPGVPRVLIQSGVALLAAAWLGCKAETWVGWLGAGLASGVGTFTLVAGLAAPSAFWALDRFMRRLGHAVGVGLSWLMLAPLFYLVFAPVRAVLKLKRRDPMRRQFPTPEASCWTPRRRTPSRQSYAKQY